MFLRVVFILLALVMPATAAEPIKVIAAENFYGDIVAQIGGTHVVVTSVLNNPDQDPHLFEANLSLAKAVQEADLIVLNGAGYDSWMDRLVRADKREVTLDVAQLTGVKDGENPHLWYDVGRMQVLAENIAAALSKRDPADASDFARGLTAFKTELSKLDAKIIALKARFPRASITATEPVFGYMAARLGFEMRNEGFQLAIMNGAEPSVSQVQAFEHDLKTHAAKLMLFNMQASSPAVERLKKLAEASGVAVVGISETAPVGVTYQRWMSVQLDAIDMALSQ